MKTNKKILTVLTALGLSSAFADNPIFQTYYSPDPAPVVVDDTVFVYSGNDLGGDFFTMSGYRVSSSTDMVNWTDRGTIILSHADFPNAKANGDWAAQCVRRNGKFYFYVTVESTRGGRAVNVAVADNPAGPFKNATGDNHLAGPNWAYIDPTVLVDDNGDAYLYWGNPTLYYAKLNDDMISFDGGIKEFDMNQGFAPNGEESKYTEGPWIHKRNGKYYMIYASHGVPEKISYSTSGSPTGPWTWGGVIMDNNNSGGAFTNHAGIIDFKGRSFFFYHNARLPGGGGYSRSTAVEEFTWNADGSIPTLKMTDLGVEKPIHYLDPYSRVEAETKAFSKDISVEKDDSRGVFVTNIKNNAYIKVRSVDFGVGADSITICTKGNAGTVEVRLGSESGTLLGTLQVPSTSSWQETTFPISGVSGLNDIFFVFKTGGFDFDYWYFTSNALAISQGPYNDVMGTIPGKIEAENYDIGGHNKAFFDNDLENQGFVYREDEVDIVGFECSDSLSTKDCKGYAIGYTQDNEWVEFTVNILAEGEYVFRANVASGLDVGGFQLFLDGEPITDTLSVPQGEDWVTYSFVEGKTFNLEKGEYVLRLLFIGSYVNFDYIQFALTEEELSIKPQIPYNANFTLDTKESLQVFNTSGRFVGFVKLNGNSLTEVLKASGLAKGVYVVKSRGLSMKFFVK